MVLLTGAGLLVGFTALHVAFAQTALDFNWTSIEPSTNISWVDCYPGFQCARFQVPLNYSNPDVGSTAIAVIKLNATMENGSEYGGPIITNPGGPGGNGVGFILVEGIALQEKFGNQFDVIGFDPRGVGFSTPSVIVAQSAAEISSTEPFDLNSTADALPEAWAKYQAYGQAAQARDNGILNFVTTGNVARDMLGMVEALGQEQIQYFGQSYGTVLGATFATMFPDRVGRMILDGCVDMDGYFGSDYFSSGLLDADKALQTFFDGCHAAGPEACPFYASSPSEIAANLESIYTSLRSQPVPVFTGNTFGVLTYDTLRQVIFNAISSPYAQFKLLATGLAELSNGNGTIIFETIFGDSTEPADPAVTALILNGFEAFIAILCSDADPLNATVPELRESMAEINSTFAGVFALPTRNRCAGWKFHPDDRFRGPVGANTSNPLLLIGNTADPRTPLASTMKTSSMFPGSAVLVQDSPGHPSSVARSNCTSEHIGAYFATGKLPTEGTVCQVDDKLFPLIS
ncbi:hypothetical protein VKT23_002871 [Stygiomarasmius scandens]|uniref:Uncharacterized protein n=1 Tax=Marasmiellus scandens TaxID=2682957 RepID=A0ABR1JYA6_9AGAR